MLISVRIASTHFTVRIHSFHCQNPHSLHCQNPHSLHSFHCQKPISTSSLTLKYICLFTICHKYFSGKLIILIQTSTDSPSQFNRFSNHVVFCVRGVWRPLVSFQKLIILIVNIYMSTFPETSQQ